MMCVNADRLRNEIEKHTTNKQHVNIAGNCNRRWTWRLLTISTLIGWAQAFVSFSIEDSHPVSDHRPTTALLWPPVSHTHTHTWHRIKVARGLDLSPYILIIVAQVCNYNVNTAQCAPHQLEFVETENVGQKRRINIGYGKKGQTDAFWLICICCISVMCGGAFRWLDQSWKLVLVIFHLHFFLPWWHWSKVMALCKPAKRINL